MPIHRPLVLLAGAALFSGGALMLACNSPVSSPVVPTKLTAADESETVAQAPATTSAAKAPASNMSGDWPMWGGDGTRNNVPSAKNIATSWDIGGFDRKTGAWLSDKAKNIKWVGQLGSQSYGNCVVSNGKVYIGTNNGAGHLKRYPSDVDLGVFLCFDEATGKLLWQHSSEKLKEGRVVDWPLQGICAASYAEGDRVWFVTSRGEVRCLDAEGFHDGENDGPYKDEDNENKDEADVIWVLNFMKELGVFQHNMCSCSVAAYGDLLFVCTSNGVDNSHINIPSIDAPSFLCVNKNTGEVIWTDKTPGANILHGQWSSPAIAEIDGVPQVIFAGGDGWFYAFRAADKKELLWKFDANPKESKYILGGRGTRNEIIATPVVYDNKVYVAVGQDPEHGEGMGHLWCLDPTKRGDISLELAVKKDNPSQVLPVKRLQAVVPEEGDAAISNPNSGVIWHYGHMTKDEYDEADFEDQMHRSCGTVAIKDDLLYIADFSGLFHCLDAKTGKRHWVYDMLAAAWGSPLIVDGHVYIGDEDGDIAIFKLSADPEVAMNDGEPIEEINMGNSVYSTPIVANNVLYISNRTHLFAIQGNEE
jgi:outer membrane protein assembly factor BamB